jgi:hypothetical protein
MNTWIDEAIKAKIRKVFEPRYKRPITDEEVIIIALNLTNFMDHFFQYKWRIANEKNNE